MPNQLRPLQQNEESDNEYMLLVNSIGKQKTIPKTQEVEQTKLEIISDKQGDHHYENNFLEKENSTPFPMNIMRLTQKHM